MVHPLEDQLPRLLNSVLKELGFRGEFHRTGETVHFIARWPYPPTLHFPGMIIDRQARVLNGTWMERTDRRRFCTWLKFYTGLLKRYSLYRGKYPLPDEGDCRYCRGDITSYRTMYAPKNHLRLHLKRGEIFGTLLWTALEAEGYADSGKLDILGYGQGPAQVSTLAFAVSNYFKSQGGF